MNLIEELCSDVCGSLFLQLLQGGWGKGVGEGGERGQGGEGRAEEAGGMKEGLRIGAQASFEIRKCTLTIFPLTLSR